MKVYCLIMIVLLSSCAHKPKSPPLPDHFSQKDLESDSGIVLWKRMTDDQRTAALKKTFKPNMKKNNIEHIEQCMDNDIKSGNSDTLGTEYTQCRSEDSADDMSIQILRGL